MALTDGLISVWHMNNNWQDSYGTNHGTAYGTIFIAPGKLGSHAGVWDGIDDHVLSANNVNIVGNAPRTIAGWFYVSSDGVWGRVLWNWGLFNGGQWCGLLIANFPSPGFRKLYFGGYAADVMGATQLNLNTYYHGVITYDGTTLNIYLNGVLDATGIISLNTVNSPFEIGKQAPNSSQQYWHGKQDEVAIWNRAITADEVVQLYNNGDGIELGEIASPISFPHAPKVVRDIFIPKAVKDSSITKSIRDGHIPKVVH